MATRTKGKSPKGRPEETTLPKMINQFQIAKLTGISATTIRKQATADPPGFPRPSAVVGIFLLWEESKVRDRLGMGSKE